MRGSGVSQFYQPSGNPATLEVGRLLLITPAFAITPAGAVGQQSAAHVPSSVQAHPRLPATSRQLSAPESLPHCGRPPEQGPVGFSRAPRPSFFDVLFVEPHSWHVPPLLVAGKRENVRYSPRSRCERPITALRLTPSLAAIFAAESPLSLKLLKSSVRDSGPKTPCKISHFSHADHMQLTKTK
jgi:hypothetical protein